MLKTKRNDDGSYTLRDHPHISLRRHDGGWWVAFPTNDREGVYALGATKSDVLHRLTWEAQYGRLPPAPGA